MCDYDSSMDGWRLITVDADERYIYFALNHSRDSRCSKTDDKKNSHIFREISMV